MLFLLSVVNDYNNVVEIKMFINGTKRFAYHDFCELIADALHAPGRNR